MATCTCAPSLTVSVTRYEPEVRPDPATVDGWPVQAKSPMNEDVGESVQCPRTGRLPHWPSRAALGRRRRAQPL